jgi:starvation-inducible outer membrane lipoprotein
MHTPNTHRLFFVVLALGLSALAFAQSRVDTYSAASVSVTDVQLMPLPDGGCAARWCGEVIATDGETKQSSCTPPVELRGAANQNRCAQLVQAGTGRLLRNLRFVVDAGAAP